MNIILDEKTTAEKVVKTGRLYKDNLYKTIDLLIKYWYLTEGLKKVGLRKKLNEFLNKNYNDYSQAKMEDKIEKSINKYLRNRSEFVNVKSVSITKGELEYIKQIDNIILEKLVFVILVYCKVDNDYKPKYNESIYLSDYKIKEIFKDAKITCSNNEKINYISDIQEYGAVSMGVRVDGDWLNINFINEDDKVEFMIEDFEEFIVEYLEWRGEEILNCEVCGRKIFKVNNKVKYCDECAKEKQRETWRKSKQKIRYVHK